MLHHMEQRVEARKQHQATETHPEGRKALAESPCS